MIVTGEPIGAAEARADGIIDEIVEGDLTAAAVDFARRVVRGGAAAAARARSRRKADRRGVCRRRRGADPAAARPGSAGRLCRGRAQRHRPALRGRAEARIRAVSQAGRRRPVEGAAPYLLRRARGGQSAGHAGRRQSRARSRAARSSAPARWAAASRCASPMPASRSPSSRPAATCCKRASTGSPPITAQPCRAAGSAPTRWSAGWV